MIAGMSYESAAGRIASYAKTAIGRGHLMALEYAKAHMPETFTIPVSKLDVFVMHLAIEIPEVGRKTWATAFLSVFGGHLVQDAPQGIKETLARVPNWGWGLAIFGALFILVSFQQRGERR